MDHISIAVFDYERNKLCDLYDSSVQADGQVYDIVLTEELGGYKEINFKMPFVIDQRRNFRWDYIKNEYLLRLKIENEADWFVVQKPKPSKNGKTITNEVTCPHLSV